MRWVNSRKFARHIVAAALLSGALSSSVPVARWCPMPWDHVPAAIYLRCSLFAASGAPHFALAPATPAAAVCAMASNCGAAGSSCAAGMSCSRTAAAATPHGGKTRGRAYCLTDPGLSSVWRPIAPSPRNPAPASALIAAVKLEPAMARTRGLEGEAPPPGADPSRRPPVRGPPARSLA